MSTVDATWKNDPALNERGLPKRSVWQAMWRGFRMRCPNCGEGKLLRNYLKAEPACAHCGEDLSHQRADDAPPYFTILIVGHVVVPIMVAVALATTWPAYLHFAIWLPLTAIMCLILLPLIKGSIIGLQWALRMHGFDGSEDPDAMPEGFLKPDDPELTAR